MSVFNNFTNLYSLSKTLRFELKPVGKTLENMKNHLRYDKDLQTFLADQEIEDAYQKLKPELDKLNEEFINLSLESDEAYEIDFSAYLNQFRDKSNLKEEENKLRTKIGDLYENAGKAWKSKYSKYTWKKGSKIAEGATVLQSQDILQLIKDKNTESKDIQKIVEDTFKGFFTYFQGFNQNRENYYTTKEEKSTAIATRIVHENLPKFCDNCIQFNTIIKKKKDGTNLKEERKEEYKNIYRFLKSQGKTTQIKDAHSGEMIELSAIDEKVLNIGFYNKCLSQSGIEEYNRIIGQYNSLINLYNQAKRQEEKDLPKSEKTFKDLPKFKTLYKQIGCGEKKALFFALTHNTKKEAEDNKENYPKPYSVEQILELANLAGEKYFTKSESIQSEIKTIPDLIEFILNQENYNGIYWSKTAFNTISSKYFANWHTLKDLLIKDNVVQKGKTDEDNVKIPEAIELSDLFKVLNKVEEWKSTFFKDSLTKVEGVTDQNEIRIKEKRSEIIKKSNSPSEAILKMIFADMSENMNSFLNLSNTILLIRDYQKEESKIAIKQWMDKAKYTIQILKYFHVRESKIKKDNSPLNTDISNALKQILFEAKLDDGTEVNWFKWYDALRNYLTRKPQDSAKENKLKLNFESPNLLGGWSDGQEKAKKSVILKNKSRYFLGILKKSSLFDTEDENNQIYLQDKKSDASRLILANIKFQTLAGRGFIRDFGKSYGEIGKENPMLAVESLKILIKKQYLKKYPLLEKVLDKVHKDKKEFDKDIQEILKECYVCEFVNINWHKVIQEVESGNLYLFEITTKDNNKKATGKPNQQTIYWNNVFSEGSLHQLNGGGEIFYRKQAISEKNAKIGYGSKPWIIENKRFTKNEEVETNQVTSAFDGKSFFFHCPVKLNYKSKLYSKPEYALKEFNEKIDGGLFKHSKVYFLGLDRGEKHLVYYSLVDQNGVMVKQGSLNLAFKDKDGKPRSIKKDKYFYNKQKDEWEKKEVDCWDYNDMLDAMASNRDMARKNWQAIGNIKNLKEGYISQLVHEIAKIVMDKPTFIVLEDLNTGFKRGRQKIEKQIYQKFEVALAKKLNFLVDKNAKEGELGSVTNALQLTPPVQNYSDIENKKQVGIMLYTRANYTSQTDPLTGWRKKIYLKTGSEENIKKQIIENFSEIEFDGKDYKFTYIDKDTGKHWDLYSGINGKSLDRFRGERGKDKYEWNIKKIDIVEILEKIFEGFDKSRSLLSQINNEGKAINKYTNEHTAWESLRFAIDLIQQIRNSGDISKGEDDNFLLSPVRDEKSESHFDSRDYKKIENPTLPRDADANGAYNIARKGIIMHEHIKEWVKNGKPKKDKNTSDLNMFISDKEWDLWLKNKKEWQRMIQIFSSKKEMEEFRKAQ